MRLTVFGASGATGRRLVEQALDAGHAVTAVVRDPARLPMRHDRLAVVVADVLDSTAIQPAVANADVVVSALGPHPPRNKSSIMSAATARILDAMRAVGSSRLVVAAPPPSPATTTAPPCPTGCWWHRSCGRCWAVCTPTWR
jgi:putative NADH-flavin reductase